MQTSGSKIVLHIADSTQMGAYTAAPTGQGQFPGIILIQEAFGVTGHIRGIADGLAAEGYVVVAPEIFHRTAAPGAEFAYSDWGAITPHYSAIGHEGLQGDLHACYDWLQSQGTVVKEKIGSIGFCLGGRVSFIANAILPLSGAVSYYGGGLNNVAVQAKDLRAPHLFIWGGLDKHILPEHVETVINAMKENNKPYANVVFGYADHAFNNNERPNYNADASAEAWALTLAFFKNKFK